MPPHIDETVPEHGGVLADDTVILRGYSLEYADLAELDAHCLTTERGVVSHTVRNCEWVGSDLAGHVGGTQQRCELRVTLEGLTGGNRYRISFLDTVVEFVVEHAPEPPDPKEPSPPVLEGSPAGE
jgi:hypothetical protein